MDHEYYWCLFMQAALTNGSTVQEAASVADLAMQEYKKRFNKWEQLKEKELKSA